MSACVLKCSYAFQEVRLGCGGKRFESFYCHGYDKVARLAIRSLCVIQLSEVSF